jgi:hypothetical protein
MLYNCKQILELIPSRPISLSASDKESSEIMATREEIIEKFAHGQSQGLSNNPQTSLDTPPESTRSGTQIQESYHRYASKATGVAPQPIIGSIPVPISSYTGRYPFGKNRSSDEEDEEDCGGINHHYRNSTFLVRISFNCTHLSQCSCFIFQLL